MANAKKKLSNIIKEIVQQEVEKQLIEIFGDKEGPSLQKAQNEMLDSFSATNTSYTKDASLNEALNATANDEGYKTMKKYDSADARSQFMQMQGDGGKPTVESMIPQDLANKTVDKATEKALTRDYTELVKRFKKK